MTGLQVFLNKNWKERVIVERHRSCWGEHRYLVFQDHRVTAGSSAFSCTKVQWLAGGVCWWIAETDWVRGLTTRGLELGFLSTIFNTNSYWDRIIWHNLDGCHWLGVQHCAIEWEHLRFNWVQCTWAVTAGWLRACWLFCFCKWLRWECGWHLSSVLISYSLIYLSICPQLTSKRKSYHVQAG